jgi:hypothetical protein
MQEPDPIETEGKKEGTCIIEKTNGYTSKWLNKRIPYVDSAGQLDVCG